MATTAFAAWLMSLCQREFSATQYAVLAGLSSLPGRLAGGASGALAAALGWPGFFLLTIALALPGLLLCARLEVQD
jgi:PAT family beta-lactamase induction signal transducer AmpG